MPYGDAKDKLMEIIDLNDHIRYAEGECYSQLIFVNKAFGRMMSWRY